MRVVDSPLLTRDESRQVGHTPLSCIIVDLEQPARCNGELALEKGVITLQGLLTDEQRFAVTGGTGAFAHVTGESRGVVDTSDGVKIRLTVQLRGVR
jgi:hypothetical protein